MADAEISTKIYTDNGGAGDTLINNTNTTFNYGALTEVRVGGLGGGIFERGLINCKMPEKPDNADSEPTNIRLQLYQTLADPARTYVIYSLDRVFLEGTGTGSATGDGATWNTFDGVSNWETAGGDYTEIIAKFQTPTGTGYFAISLARWARFKGITWGSEFSILLLQEGEAAAAQFRFNSRDYGTDREPILLINYNDDSPILPDDGLLKVEPNPDNIAQSLLKWPQPKASDLGNSEGTYLIVKSPNPNITLTDSTAEIVGKIVNKGEIQWIDDQAYMPTTENTVFYYVVLLCDATNYIEVTLGNTLSWHDTNSKILGIPRLTNEVWMIRPEVSAFSYDDSSPDVKQTITATLTSSTNPTTPQDVADAAYAIDWIGDGSEKGQTNFSEPQNPTTVLKEHQYFSSETTITPIARFINTLGFASDWTDLSSAPINVSPINPTSVLRKNPYITYPYAEKLTGTITFVAGVTQTGTGTLFLSELEPGEWIIKDLDARMYRVRSIESDTSLTLQRAYSGPAGAASVNVIRGADLSLVAEDSFDNNSDSYLGTYEYAFEIGTNLGADIDDMLWSQTTPYYNDEGEEIHLEIAAAIPLPVSGEQATVTQGSRVVTGNGFTGLSAGNTFKMKEHKLNYVIKEVIDDENMILEDKYQESSITDGYWLGFVSSDIDARVRVTSTASGTPQSVSSDITIQSRPIAGLDIIKRIGELMGNITSHFSPSQIDTQLTTQAGRKKSTFITEGLQTPQVQFSVTASGKDMQALLKLLKDWQINDVVLRWFHHDTYWKKGKKQELRDYPLRFIEGRITVDNETASQSTNRQVSCQMTVLRWMVDDT